MSNVAAKKVFIQIETPSEQQEHLKNQRKTLKVVQGTATDKENLTGRSQLDKLNRLKAAADATLASTPDFIKRKKVDTRPAETQTTPHRQETTQSDSSTSESKRAITVDDLTNETAAPSEHYWERLAEKRREALESALDENQRLHERVEGLEEELSTSRQMLEEARNLVEVLTEMLNENEAERETKSETSESETTNEPLADHIDAAASEPTDNS